MSFIRSVLSVFLVLFLFSCGSDPTPAPPGKFIIRGTATAVQNPDLTYTLDLQLAAEGSYKPMITYPAKFTAENNKQPNVPAFIVKMVESELKHEETLLADWNANTGYSQVKWDSPVPSGDVQLAGGIWSGGSWTQKTSGSTIRHEHTAIIYNNKIYIFGGYNGSSYLNDVWEYDIAGDSWTQKHTGSGTAPGVRRDSSAIVYNGKMYIFGGWNGGYLNDVWEYDLTNHSWTQKTSGATARQRHTAVVYNGKMYIFGGGIAASPNYANDVWEYDIAGDSWTQKTSGASIREDHVAVVYNGKMYIFGGFCGYPTSTYLSDVWEYDLTAHAWAQKTSRATTCHYHSAVVFGDNMCIFGGIVGNRVNEVWEYNFNSHTWAQKTSGSTARSNHTAIVNTDGKMYIFGGHNGTSYLNDVWEDFLGYYGSGWIKTAVMDMGSVPAVNGEWRFAILIPNGTSVVFEAWSSATGAFAGEETSLGTVVDGTPITDLKRYYKIRATLYANTARDTTPTLRSIMASFLTFRAVSDRAAFGYELSLQSVSSLQTTIDAFKESTIGQVSVQLALTRNVSDYLKTKYPKNKEVRIYMGYEAPGFAEADFVDYYRGIVDDWSLDNNDTVTLRLRDFHNQWKDYPIPSKWQSASDDKTWTAMHPVDIILDILKGHIGIPDRYIEQDSFNNVKLATDGWVVTRTLTGKTFDCKTLVEELRKLLSAFFIPNPDGKVRLKRWDASEAAVMSLSDNEMKGVSYDSNTKSLLNRSYIYFNINNDGTGRAGGIALDTNIDSASQANWGEIKTEEQKDYWTVTAEAAQVADRSNKIIARFANIPDILSFELDRRFIALEAGDMVSITTKRAPSSDLNGIANVKYQIINRNLDAQKDKLALKVLRTA